MQIVKTFYEISEFGVEKKLNSFLEENPNLSVKLISSGAIHGNNIKMYAIVVFESMEMDDL